MKRRTLIIGDIHGAYKALKQVLKRADIRESDQLIFLGDYVDGWSESVETIDYLIQLNTTHDCVFLRGNHDELCTDWMQYGDKNPKWLTHGGQSTVDSYLSISRNKFKIHLNFLEKRLLNSFIDDENRLFVHAGFTNLGGVKMEYYQKMLYWDRTLWEMVLALDQKIEKEDELYPKRLLNYKEIYIGHTPVTRIGQTIPVQAANVWNIDTGAAFKGPLTIIDVDTKEYWQSDPVYTLYPNEEGRN